jgi:hypothetical protein
MKKRNEGGVDEERKRGVGGEVREGRVLVCV